MDIDLKKLVRQNIWQLTPYSCARNEYSGDATVYLDANENPYGAPFNRYPDPLQQQLKQEIAKMKGIPMENIFVGNGSDEAIDLVFRIFCEPHTDNVVAMAPTYGMYEVSANINDVEYRRVMLNPDFSLSASSLLSAIDENTKVIWLCSPNNPTGNSLAHSEIDKVIMSFPGIVVIDEAYIDFSKQESYRFSLDHYPNIIVLHTLSKAWAAAAIRMGMAFASKEIIRLMNKVKYPYNVSLLTQEKALEIIMQQQLKNVRVATILSQREHLITALKKLDVCEEIFPTDANFFLMKVKTADKVYNHLLKYGIVVRNRSNVELCHDMLRITVGSSEENDSLIDVLKKY